MDDRHTYTLVLCIMPGRGVLFLSWVIYTDSYMIRTGAGGQDGNDSTDDGWDSRRWHRTGFSFDDEFYHARGERLREGVSGDRVGVAVEVDVF